VKIRFLLDENLDPRLRSALLRRNAGIDIRRVGDPETPPRATPDPDILRYAERTQRLLVTNNRASMAIHLAAHYAAGGRHWGVLRIRDGASLGQLVDALLLFWEASEDEEWADMVDWIPF
jgi:hypothetical protein